MFPRRLRPRTAILAAIAGVTVFGGSYGLAASLNLNSDSLGSAQTVVAACQTGTLSVVYAPAYSAAVPGYNTTSVTISGLTSGCYGKSYWVTLNGAAGASLGEVTGTAPGSGSTIGPLSITASAAAVTGVAVVFEG